MTGNDKKLLLAITHFHNQAEVLQFVRHVTAFQLPTGYELHIAVTDNSRDWNRQADCPEVVSVSRPPRNLGYLNGCAYAFRDWCDRYDRIPDWLGIVNTDIEFQTDFFTRLLEGKYTDSDAIVAPDIVLPSGERQNPHLRQRASKVRLLSYRWIFANRTIGALFLDVRARFKRKRTAAVMDNLNEDPVSIYAPHGSAMFIRRLFFDAGGELEYDAFLYCEELHLAEQAARAAVGVVWIPGLRLLHKEHSTTGSLGTSRRLEWMCQAYRFILDRYYR